MWSRNFTISQETESAEKESYSLTKKKCGKSITVSRTTIFAQASSESLSYKSITDFGSAEPSKYNGMEFFERQKWNASCDQPNNSQTPVEELQLLLLSDKTAKQVEALGRSVSIQSDYVLVIELSSSLQISKLSVAISYCSVGLCSARVLANLLWDLQNPRMVLYGILVFPLPLQWCPWNEPEVKLWVTERRVAFGPGIE